MKILLIYPNSEGYGRIPLGLSILSSCLKDKGHEVELFDLTFLVSSNKDNEMREKIGIAKKIDTSVHWGSIGNIDVKKLLIEKVEAFKPGLIGISVIQNNYWNSIDLLKEIRQNFDIPIVAGGTFATIYPQSLFLTGLVDVIVRGEGEGAIVELADAFESGNEIKGIDNCVFFEEGNVRANPVRAYADLNTIPFQDISIFDQRHLMKPFDGKMVRAGYFELSRGCPFSCTYCANFYLNEVLYASEKCHIRFKNAARCVNEIEALNKEYQYNFIFFADENMLSLNLKELKKLARLWKDKVKLPFYITTRVEMSSEDKIEVLKDMGCATIAFGIESGNEKFRKKVLKRANTNDQIIRAFKLCKKYGIRTTANNIFGFPYETESDIFDTIKLNMESAPDSFSNSIFAPYIGTELYDVCLREGYVNPGIPSRISMIDDSILTMPQISRERILELYMNFIKYLSGELSIPVKMRNQ